MMTVTKSLKTGNDLPRFVTIFIGLILATSSVVFIEPAPYDLLLLALFSTLLFLGLGFPREMHLATLILAVYALANIFAF